MPPCYFSGDELETCDEGWISDASNSEKSCSSDAGRSFTESREKSVGIEAQPNESKWLDSIRPSQFISPRSQYGENIPPLPLSVERDVIADLLNEIRKQKARDSEAGLGRLSPSLSPNIDEDFTEFELGEFSIYLPDTNSLHGGTMIGLQNLATKPGHAEYLFDGVLTAGVQDRYVEKVPFQLCSIGQYGQEFDSIGDDIWIQSNLGKRRRIFYRLKKPSAEYRRFYKGFLWLANLSKNFVDYISNCFNDKRDVSIHNFKTGFHSWLEKTHKNSKSIRNWMRRFNGTDFRGHVAANIEFLYKETSGTHPELRKLQIWKETRDLNFVPLHDIRELKTVVTPYVYDCFSHLKFAPHLIKVSSSSDVQMRRKKVARDLNFTIISPSKQRVGRPEMRLDKSTIAIGEVLAVAKDNAGIAEWKSEHSKWKAADENWFALVQKINFDRKGKRKFDILWLYSPSDTTCAKMKYPYSRELFLSDNCSCSTRPIPEDDVRWRVSITWNGSPEKFDTSFFVRQTYLMDNRFITLQDIHKQCVHIRGDTKTALLELISTYKVGDTVLFIPPPHLNSKHDLEPGEIVKFAPNGRQELVLVRRLYRLLGYKGMTGARANELVYSDDLLNVPVGSVQRNCFIRLYTEEDIADNKIPAPYNRDGTGNAFYITKRVVGNSLRPVHSNFPLSLLQGPDFEARPRSERLRGLDLFCGGGNFGRGLEEGGGVHNTHAVDLNRNAIHTYFANLKDPESTKLYYGSVNDLLAEALRGSPSKSAVVPLPGDIDFISAGSPCPGFSHLNNLRDAAKGLRDQSLVASVAAFIDLYRPKYALLENVVTMAQKGAKREEDVLSQLICCLVGMGYQVQVFNLDAWSVGSPQSRGRLFVSIAAPGLEPPSAPALSHSHPAQMKRRGLGLMANGLSFGERRFERTPFKFIMAGEATQDVPDIGDGRTFHCTWHSDHRMSRGIDPKLKAQIESIPLYPRGMNYVKSVHRMVPSERILFPTVTKAGRQRQSAMSSSKAYGRVNPQQVFPPIATVVSTSCSRTGIALHWNQQRLLTVLEVRRAQSFPDEEVLLGSPALQWRIVGNSVARTASLALGLSICEAWVKSCKSGPQSGVGTKTYLNDGSFTSNAKEVLTPSSPSIESMSTISYSISSKKRQRTSSASESPYQPRTDKRRLLGPTSPRSPKETLPVDLSMAQDFDVPPSPPGFWDAFQQSSTQSLKFVRKVASTLTELDRPKDIPSPMRSKNLLQSVLKPPKLPIAALAQNKAQLKRKSIPERPLVCSTSPKAIVDLSSSTESDDDIIIVRSTVESRKPDLAVGRDGGSKAEGSIRATIVHRPSQNRQSTYIPVDNNVFKAYEVTKTSMTWKSGR